MRVINAPSRCPLCRLQCEELEGPEELYKNAVMLHMQYQNACNAEEQYKNAGESFRKFSLAIDLLPDFEYVGRARGLMEDLDFEGKVGEQDLEQAFNLFAKSPSTAVINHDLAMSCFDGDGSDEYKDMVYKLLVKVDIWGQRLGVLPEAPRLGATTGTGGFYHLNDDDGEGAAPPARPPLHESTTAQEDDGDSDEEEVLVRGPLLAA